MSEKTVEHLGFGTDKVFFIAEAGINHNGFLPTGETVAFLYSGNEIKKRLEVSEIFSVNHIFHKHDLIYLNETNENEPLLSGQLIINNNFLELITIGYEKIPSYSKSFPAKEIISKIGMSDLIISNSVQKALKNLNNWLKYNSNLDLNNNKIHKGYKALFYGPPGTGKTLTAGIIGEINNRKVLKVDLSQIQSKWVGETEKTLSKIFNKADNKGWILFFDEADAIFGKRSSVVNSNEQYANQTVSYLLQRIEDYNGMIILASNLKGNIDQAFIRRFQSIIHFTIPDAKLREKLWNLTFKGYSLDKNIDVKNLSKVHDFSGASINNIFNYCLLQIIGDQKQNISKSILNDAIKYELRKEGRY